MRKRPSPGLLCAVLALSLACASTKTLVPPKVDLERFGTIGMVQLDGNVDPELAAVGTQALVAAMQAAQPGTPVLELGDEREVLAAVGHTAFGPEAVKAIGRHYGVDSVMAGQLGLSSMRPRVRMGQMLDSFRAAADVDGSLTARLLQAKSGATLWTREARRRENVGHVGITTTGLPTFSANDPESAAGKLVRNLAYWVTEDFRSHWVED